jgi:hypothetical protein
VVDRPSVSTTSMRSQPNSSSTPQALLTSSGVGSLARCLRYRDEIGLRSLASPLRRCPNNARAPSKAGDKGETCRAFFAGLLPAPQYRQNSPLRQKAMSSLMAVLPSPAKTRTH